MSIFTIYMQYDNKGKNQPKLSISKKFLRLIDHINERFASTIYLDPKLILTENRKDIDYRIDFLNKTLNEKVDPAKTLYGEFISDKEREFNLDKKIMMEQFATLFEKIKGYGITKPLIVGKFDSDKLKTRYFHDGRKIWKNYKNYTGFQLIDGAHRLACAIFLELEQVPVKIYSPISFEIPNYTDYIELNEEKYKQNMM